MKRNPNSILGPGFADDALRPTQHLYLRNVVAIAAGDVHAVVVTSDGRAFTWGSNAAQQLAIARPFLSTTPLPVRDPLASYANSDLVVEFFNPKIVNGANTAGLGHYFITASSEEATAIDSGRGGLIEEPHTAARNGR